MPNVKTPHLSSLRRHFQLPQLRFLCNNNNHRHFRAAERIDNSSVMDSHSSPHGSIIFSTVGRSNYGFDIFSVKSPFSFLNSPVEHRLTDGISVNYNGQFVDDDQTLVFVSERSGAPRIYLRRPPSSQVQIEQLPAPVDSLFLDRPFLRNERLCYISAHQQPKQVFTSSSALYSTNIDDRGGKIIRVTPYGCVNFQSNPSQFEPYDLEKSVLLPLSGRDSPTAISTTENGSVQVAHGCKITSFDWSLKRKSTILTQFPAIDSMLSLNSRIVAVGATDFSGLQILDVVKGSVEKNLNWENVTKSGSTVQAIGSSGEFLFTSFESSRRNSNCIMVYDVNDDFKPVTKIGHYEIFGAELDSAIPATKLRWLPSHNLLMSAGSHSGPSGVVGNIKFWDLRSGNSVWEIKENVDCFSDITVSDSLTGIFKVGVHSGEVSLADLRNIGSENAWFCLGDQRKVRSGKKEGIGCKIESHGNQVFCTKGGNIELWSEVLIDGLIKGRFGSEGKVFRKNFMGRAKDFCGNRITHFSFGGNRMFVTRKDQQFVEVWQSSVRGF